MNRLSTFLIFILSSIAFRSSAFDCSDITTQALCSSSILCTWNNGLCTGSMTITCSDHCVFVQNFNMTQSGDGSLQFPSNSLTDTIDAISKPTTIILIALNYADVFEVAGLHVLPNSTTIKPFVDTIRPRIQLANSFSLTWTLFEENPDILTISIENLIFEPADTSQVRNVPFVDLSSTRLTVESCIFRMFRSNGPFISLDFGNFLVSNTVFQDSENFYINYATKVNRPAVITISITDSVVYNLTGELFLNVSDSANIILQNVTINQNIQESTLDQNCWINVLQEAGLQFTDSVVTDSSLCLIKMDLETISSQFQLDNVSLNNIDLLANKVLILVVNAQDFDISNLELTNIFNVKTLIAMQDSIVTIENLTLYNINAFYEESQLFDGVQLIGSLISGYNNELSMTGINATNISSPAIYLKQSEIDLSVANFKNTEYATSLNSDRFSSLILLDSSIMNMNSSIFSGFNGVNGGVISFLGYYINQGTTILQNSIFQNNFAQNYGGVIFSENVQCFIEIENCSFTNNSAVDGGVINIKAQSLNFFSDANSRPLAILNSTFEKNQVSDKGGVIFSKDFISVENSNFYENTAAYGGALYRSFPLQENPNNVQDILTSCQFHMNTATEQGGAFLILTRDTNYQISGIDYFENTAPIYDDFFIGLPTSIVMKAYSIKSDIVSLNENQRLLQDISQLDTYKNQELFASSDLDTISQYKIDLKSGSYLSQIFELSVLDQNGNIHLGINGDSIDVSLDNCDYSPQNQSNSLKGKTSIAFVNGRVLLYNQFESYAGINRNCSLIIKSNQQASPTLEESNFNIAVNFTIGFSGCSYGEVFDQTLQICKSCEPGTYSLTDPDSTYECIECPFDKADCPGNNIIALKPGYWRQNEFTDLIRECPDVSNACLGSMYDTNYVPSGKCQELREGPFCEECISGYIKIDNPSECINCANNKLYYFRYAGFLIIQTGLLLASLYLNIKRSLNAQSQDEISKKRLSFRTTLLKIHINFLQSMSIISRLKLRWTKRLNMIPILLSDTVPMNEDAITSECIIESVFQGILSSHFVRFVIISCLPLLLWLISIIVFRAIKRNRTNPLMPLPKFMIVSFITIASIFQPAILQIGLKTFDCTSLFDGNSDKTFMREDLTIECSSNTFYALALGLVIPFLMFWAVILPAALFLKLRQNKNVKVPNFHASVFAPSDQERTYYWGYVFYLEKFILILVSVFLTSVSLRVQVLIAFVVLLLLFILQMKHKPYHDSKLNKVESFSVLILMLYVYSGLFFINDINTVSPDILLLVGFVVVLSVYLGHFIVFMIRPFKNKIFVTIGTQELFAKDSQRDISPTSQLQSTDRQRLRTKQFSSVMNYNLERGTPSSVTDSKIDGILLTNEPLSTARLFSQKENGTLKDCSTPTRYREQQCD